MEKKQELDDCGDTETQAGGAEWIVTDGHSWGQGELILKQNC